MSTFAIHTMGGVREAGQPVAAIWPEAPAWPEAGGPALEMVAVSGDQWSECQYRRLECKMIGDPREVVPVPLIVCPDCGSHWRQDGEPDPRSNARE